MNTIFPTRRRPHTTLAARRRILAEFERSGLSAAAFARQHGIGYSTFCAWRRRKPVRPQVGFAEVEWVSAPASEGLVVELGRRTRLQVTSAAQIELATALLQRWEATC